MIVFVPMLTECSAGGIPLELQGDRTAKVQNTMNKQQTFVFNTLPKTAEELAAMPEAAFTTPFMTAALTMAALCAYDENPSASIAMLNVLRGPQPLSAREAQFLRDCLKGKPYKPFSYFDGATLQNGYTPNKPYQTNNGFCTNELLPGTGTCHTVYKVWRRGQRQADKFATQAVNRAMVFGGILIFVIGHAPPQSL